MSRKKTAINRSGRKPQHQKKDPSSLRSKPTTSVTDQDPGNTKRKGINDISWYSNSPDLLRDAASIPFSDAIGLDVDLRDTTQSDYPVSTANLGAIPGILRVNVRPAVGIARDALSSINLAANNIYSNVRFANSGHPTGDSPDMMTYILATSQLYAYVAALCRIYGCINMSPVMNRYTPEHLCAALGADYHDLKANGNRLHWGITSLINRMNDLWIPNTMPILLRWFWLNSNIYKGSENLKAQFYFFHQTEFWEYAPLHSSEGGGLHLMQSPLHFGGASVDELLDFGEELLQALKTDEDAGNCAGDLLKAFGADKIFRMPDLDYTYKVEPVFNAEVLVQIANSMSTVDEYGANRADRLWDIAQTQTGNVSILNFQPHTPDGGTNTALRFTACKKLLDLGDMPVSPENVMIATRLLPAFGYSNRGTGNQYGEIVSCGSEVVTHYTVFRLHNAELEMHDIWSYMNGANNEHLFKVSNMLSKFRFAPAIYYYVEDRIVGVHKDLEHYTTIGAYELQRLHDTAIMSLLGMPYTVAPRNNSK